MTPDMTNRPHGLTTMSLPGIVNALKVPGGPAPNAAAPVPAPSPGPLPPPARTSAMPVAESGREPSDGWDLDGLGRYDGFSRDEGVVERRGDTVERAEAGMVACRRSSELR